MNLDPPTFRIAFVVPALGLTLASCGDGEPTLFSAPAALTSDGPLSIEGTVGEAAAPLPSFRVVDARGNPVPGVAVGFRVETGGGTVEPAELRTDEDGRVSPSSWTFGETVGANVLVADLGPVGEVHIEALAEAGPPHRIAAASAIVQSADVGSPVEEPPVVRLEDRFGNPLAGFEVVFEPDEDSGEVVDGSGTTGEDGQVGVTSWRLSTRSGQQFVDARLVVAPTLPRFRFVARAQASAPVSMDAASPTSQEADAGSRVGDSPAVLFLDQYDNPVPGVEATFTVIEGGGSVSGSPTTSGPDGVARLEGWTLGSDEGPNRLLAASGSFAEVEFQALGTPVVRTYTIDGVHLNQANQRLEGDVGGIAGRPGLLRVVASSNQVNDDHLDVRVRLYQDGALLREVVLSRSAAGVPTDPSLGSPGHTWNLPLTADEVVPGLGVEVLLDPDSLADVASRDGHRYPRDGGIASLDVQPITPLRIAFIPIELTRENRTGTVHPGNVEEFLRETRRWLPVDEIHWEIQETFTTNADLTETSGWQQLLGQLLTRRTLDDATDEYYHGIVPSFPGMRWGGYAYINGTPESESRVGLTFDGLPAASGVLAHELGHNLGRWHAPCGNPEGIDWEYPYDDAVIGQPGYDIDGELLISGSRHDYMSYCSPRWTSDYTYEALLTWRRDDPWAQASGTTLVEARTPGILVWGRVGTGGAVLHPAFALDAHSSRPQEPGPHRVRGLASDGRELFQVWFEGAHPAHADDPAERHFSFFVPLEPAEVGALDRIELDSPLGRAARQSRSVPPQAPAAAADRQVTMERSERGELRLRWDADRYPLAMLRDRDTGRVLGFAEGGELLAPDRDRRLEHATVLLSDGVRSETAVRR